MKTSTLALAALLPIAGAMAAAPFANADPPPSPQAGEWIFTTTNGPHTVTERRNLIVSGPTTFVVFGTQAWWFEWNEETIDTNGDLEPDPVWVARKWPREETIDCLDPNNADVVLREIPAPKQTFLLMPQPDGTLAGYINMDFSDTLPSCDGSVERTAEDVSARPA